MDDVLLGIVVQRLQSVPLAREASDLLLAALDSDDALSAQLGGGVERPEAGDTEQAMSPVGAYLASLTVSGFRGIGPPATLQVAPGPGLTLIVGRNGSGKSSFAEGLEILLTGSVMRWAQPAPAIFRGSWRCKHAGDAVEVRAEFVIEGAGKAEAVRNWPAGADLDGSVSWLQLAGQKRRAVDELGWSGALQEFRPFLSHSELEAFFGRPSELYDLLASVLGLDELTAASARLNAQRKSREDAHADIRRRLEPLRERLGQLDDERAMACLDALSGRTWDIAAAKTVATGANVQDGGGLDTLRRLAQLPVPSAESVSGAAAKLRKAATDMDVVSGTAAGRAMALVSLLELALKHAHEDSERDCPVCGKPAALTQQWRTQTQQHVASLRAEASAAQAAASAARTATDEALSLMSVPPAVLGQAQSATGLDAEPVLKVWAQWAKRPPGELADPGGLRSLADHLEKARAPLTAAVAALSAQASQELARRDDRWAPLAADVAAWCADAEPVVVALTAIPPIKQARAWLVSATADLRQARLAPLADQARGIWAMLRQESNVDLGAFRLSGTATQRKLELDVSIDGTPGAALGVMSQGEINALALSIFLPRATMPQSPFRFLVIDDPVQAMDPAKVDGLARVLEAAAADRQVIVFTHDNRLATAMQDLNIEATILEVTRRPKSVVQVRRCLDPVEQPLRDAAVLDRDSSLPAEVARRVIPGLCRSAVEAAFSQAIWRQQLRAGRGRDEIETDLGSARRRLIILASLALYGNAHHGGEVLARMNSLGRQYSDTLQALNKGSHQPYTGDLSKLVSDSRKLTAKIREILP